MASFIEKLEEDIKKLPKGYISNKLINGKTRHYLQWNENGKIKSEYIPDKLYPSIKEAIDYRKSLQEKLKLAKSMMLHDSTISEDELLLAYNNFEMNVLTDEELKKLISTVDSNYKRRYCFNMIQEYLYSNVSSKICILSGLRRTGKTTLILQAISQMNNDDFQKTAYIKAKNNQSMEMLDRDLKKLNKRGFKYIFIDEITLLNDFIDTASFLSDIYASMGMKIVLSGTDSLGFWFTFNEELYDRAYKISTTWISYKEYAYLLNINDIDEYIRYGGTLKACEYNFDDKTLLTDDISFKDDESTRRYIDASICKNIQHSLKYYDNGLHFGHLKELYDANELTNVINRIIENMNHQFVIKTIKENFSSSDLKLARKNLLKEKNHELRTDILSYVDIKNIEKRLMEILEIKNIENQHVLVDNIHILEIEEYLKALGLVSESEIRYDDNYTSKALKLILQPGMRYSQAKALIYSLKKDIVFETLNEETKNYVCEKILNEVKAKMIEEIILYDTMIKLKNQSDVFKFIFKNGEIAMVIYDKHNHNCAIYEIKHNKNIIKEQAKHLLDNEKCRRIEQLYGKITNKYVLYLGKSKNSDFNVEYINICEFLNRN